MNSFRLSRLRRTVTLALACLLPVAPQWASAQSADTPTRIVVGFPPGGALDSIARSLAEKLKVATRSQVVVDNRPGAATRLAVMAVKNAPPDGRSILFGPPGAFSMVPLSVKSPGYDYQADFIPVAQVVSFPVTLTINADLPYKTLTEYLEAVRKGVLKPDVGVTSLHGPGHMSMLALARKAGVNLAPVPFKGGVEIRTAVLGGHLPAGHDALSSYLPLHQAGKLRILAVSGDKRTPQLPQVPTFAEMGYPGVVGSVWFAAYVRKDTPADIVRQLERHLLNVGNDPEFANRLLAEGMKLDVEPGAGLSGKISTELEFFRPLAEMLGIKPE